MSTTSSSSYPAQLSYTTFFITIFSFIVTFFNLLALYASAYATFTRAPMEICDLLGNIRQEICEERAAMRTKMRDLRAVQRSRRRGSDMVDGGGGGGGSSTSLAEQTLRLHHATLRDIWRAFRRLERPFLVQSGFRAEQIRRGDYWGEEDLADEQVKADFEMKSGGGGVGENATEDWSAYYRCDFSHRFIWLQSKSEAVKLADLVQKVMLRRVAREVDECRGMLRQMKENGGGGGGGTGGFYDDRRGGGGGGGGGGMDDGDRTARRVKSRSGVRAASAVANEDATESDDEGDRPARRQSNTARRRDRSWVIEQRRRRNSERQDPGPQREPPDYEERDVSIRRPSRRQETEWEVVRPSQRREDGIRVIEIDVPPDRDRDLERGQRSRSRYGDR